MQTEADKVGDFRLEARRLEAADFCVIRSPLLPIETVTSLGEGLEARRAWCAGDAVALERALVEDRAKLQSRLRTIVNRPEVLEAFHVASPRLNEGLRDWLGGGQTERGRAMTDTVLKYVTRMAARPTPFGLFAGLTLGRPGERTALKLAEIASHRKHVRLDMKSASAVADMALRDEHVRERLRFVPSSANYEVAGQLRYVTRSSSADRASHGFNQIASAELTPQLEQALAVDLAGATLQELSTRLAETHSVSVESAREYVELLVAEGILLPETTPMLTGPEAFQHLCHILEERAASSDLTRRATRATEVLTRLNAEGLGTSSSEYDAVLAGLADKKSQELSLQVELYKSAGVATVGHDVIRRAAEAACCLVRLGAGRQRAVQLEDFAKRFVARWELAEVPLTTALDEETGIGFGEGPLTCAIPLLEGLRWPIAATVGRTEFGGRERLLTDRLMSLARGSTWELEDDEIETLASKTALTVPSSMWALVSLFGNEGGDPTIVLHYAGGPGAPLLGRFCHGDKVLETHVKAFLAREEQLFPEAILAELVHLPEPRVGNVIARPVLRRFEIPYHGRSGVEPEGQIPISDIVVSIRAGRVFLRSRRLGKEVRVRMASAHNHPRSDLTIYRFLAALQEQEALIGAGWSWHPFESVAYMPRVTYRGVVLSLARWNLSAKDLAPLRVKKDAFVACQRLREEKGLPRWISLVEGDNTLPIDLDSPLGVDLLASFARRKVMASEFLPAQLPSFVTGPEGKFVNEIVLSFLRQPDVEPRNDDPPAGRVPTPTDVVETRPVERLHAPGGQWLFAKLYSGQLTADAVLEDVVAKLVAEMAGRELGWFFLRYGDPEWHVRLRVLGPALIINQIVLPRLHDLAKPLLQDGRVWKMQLDTYVPELERYGGPAGLAISERIFQADSEAALAIVTSCGQDENEARWRLALVGAQRYCEDFGFDDSEIGALFERLRLGFGSNLGVTPTQLERACSDRYRELRTDLETLLSQGGGTGAVGDGFAKLDARSLKVRPLAIELQELQRRGELSVPVPVLVESYIHMWLNRVFQAEQNRQELVIYEFLRRWYRSRRARAVGGAVQTSAHLAQHSAS